jgi:predicted nucleic acid-binding protein
MRSQPGHAFWPDSISLVDDNAVDAALLSSHSRVTDGYLLALARANKGKLATMDQKLAAEVVADGKAALALL